MAFFTHRVDTNTKRGKWLMHRNDTADRPGPAAPGLSATLRDRTAGTHGAAEAAMRHDFGRADASAYLAVLRGLLVFHESVARFSWDTVASELDQDMATLVPVQSLRRDICSMAGQPASSGGSRRAGSQRPAPPILRDQLQGGREARVGAAYVAAGSVLGGRVIAAGLAAGDGRDFPRSFFASDGVDIRRRWRQFTTALDEFGEAGADPDRVVTGALGAFAFIGEILSSSAAPVAAAR